ncbi:MAG: hypothetical protein M0R50_05900 [Candidatus Cloacimonetes bacterium]|jgi:hypothetical protein|nr:hypothetical protein [Candidatus Cloacimonadota bacterium]
MIEFDIIEELGDNAELLTKSDAWLAIMEEKLGQDLTILLHDLDQIQTAIRIKQRLQQNNRVAVKRPVRSGKISDEVIEILPLTKAVKVANQTSHSDQINIWAADGYDIATVQMV